MVRLRRGQNVSPDFKYLCRNLTQIQIFTILRDNWSSYRLDYIQNPNIQAYFSNCKWVCINKKKQRKFSETCLPLKALGDTAREFGPLDIFPFLKVPTPIVDMSFLGRFGVITEVSAHFLVWLVKEIRNSHTDWSREKAEIFYTRLAASENIQDLSKYGRNTRKPCVKSG